MKKINLFLTALISILLLASCSQEKPQPPEKAFLNADDVNTMISELTEVSSIETAATLSKIIEEYQALPSTEQAKVSDFQQVLDSIETAAEFLNEDDMKISVMSFNIRYGEWGIGRQSLVLDLIDEVSPDIFGVQEANKAWVTTISSRFGKNSEYAYLGTGREGRANGEHNFVFYKKDKFNLLESETLWLTETPDILSKHPESDCYRIFTYQLLERKADGQIFLHINTHFDHVGENARVSQAQCLLSWVEETFGGQIPVVITGDFNCTKDSAAYNLFIDSGFKVTNDYGENVRTFNGYSDTGGSIIDFCFVNDFLPIVSYKVCDEKTDGQWISDHNAIVSELLLLPSYDNIEIPES